MSEGPPVLLLDSCVWMDLYVLDRPERRAAQELVAYALNHDIPLAFSSHSAMDVYAKASMSAKAYFRQAGELTEAQARAARDYGWSCVAEMQEKATAIPLDSSDFYLAGKYRAIHDDMEDNLVLAACMRARAAYLVTRDKRFSRHADICTKTPRDMLDLLKAGLAHGARSEAPTADPAYHLRRWLASYE